MRRNPCFCRCGAHLLWAFLLAVCPANGEKSGEREDSIPEIFPKSRYQEVWSGLLFEPQAEALDPREASPETRADPEWRLSGISKAGGKLRAVLHHPGTHRSIRLAEGEAVDGLKLIAVSADRQPSRVRVTVERRGTLEVLRFEGLGTPAKSEEKGMQSGSAASRRGGEGASGAQSSTVTLEANRGSVRVLRLRLPRESGGSGEGGE